MCRDVGVSQSTIRLHINIHPFKPDSVYLLSEWALEHTIKVVAGDSVLPRAHWVFNTQTGEWGIKPLFWEQYRNIQTLTISYRAYPLAIKKVYRNRNMVELDPDLLKTDSDSLARLLEQRSDNGIFDDSDLQQQGSLSRGIIVGTNQDFALESGLNFELSGRLTDDVNIKASLTDKSIPIQPDGTTQNLREFDKVYIQLQSHSTTLEMGDVDVSFEQSEFARLNRRLQGAAGFTTTKYGDYKGALSVVRGTYKSMTFDGRDGVQGPYRLSGRNDEEFVVVLAGTEKVFINGQQVNRGEENDYIIDYGLGEVYFTNNLLIKDETRIAIEYEYINQDFNRTLIAAEAGDTLLNNKFRIGVTVIRQADGDEILSQESLSEDDIEVLRHVGDNLNGAIVSGERLADDEDDINVLYAKKDTTLNSIAYSIYVHKPGSAEAIYAVSFSKVEAGTGSYKRISSAVNGIIYEWIGPGQGDYEPYRILPAPEKQQMVSFNGGYSLSKHLEFFGEFAVSDYDKNRFSVIDDGDNSDVAYKGGVNVKDISTGLGEINASFKRRFTGSRFSFFERTQDVEFDRKWNVSDMSDTKENLNELDLSLSPSTQTSVKVEYGLLNKSDFSSSKEAFSFSSNEKHLPSINYYQDWVLSSDDILLQDGDWFRHHGDINESFNWNIFQIKPYLQFEQEKKIQEHSLTDSLINSSFSFYEVGPGLMFGTNTLTIDVGLNYRRDKRVFGNELENESDALEQSFRVDFVPGANFRTKNKVIIRAKDYDERFSSAYGTRIRKGFLFNSTTSYKTNSGFIDGDIYYNVNTERQSLLQEAYIEVGPELGQYTWIDDNSDGVQQIDEFYPELSPNEGIYLRQYIPSDELLPIIDLSTRFRHTIRPFRFASSNFLREMVIRSRVDISEESTTETLSDVYLLKLGTFRNDSTTLTGRLFIEKELDLFPENEKADIILGYNYAKNFNKRSSEIQKSFSEQYSLNTSGQLSDKVKLYNDVFTGTSKSQSDNIGSRNYDIRFITVNPVVDIMINRSWQTSFSFSYSAKKDQYPVNDVKANMVKFITSQRAYLWRRFQTNAKIEFRNTEISGSSSTLGVYELTEGTGSGSHLLWSFSGMLKTSDLVRLSINYDGRTVEKRKNIHTVKITVSAIF